MPKVSRSLIWGSKINIFLKLFLVFFPLDDFYQFKQEPRILLILALSQKKKKPSAKSVVLKKLSFQMLTT